MKASQILHLLESGLDNPKTFPPLFIFGGPGVGKSSICRAAADKKAANFYDVRALLRDPVDFVGTPVPFVVLQNGRSVPVVMANTEIATDKYFVEWLAPSFLPNDPNERALLCLDELLLAPTMTTNALLQLVLDRRLGQYVLPDGVYIVALSNRESEAIGVHKLSPPLRRRFVIVDFDVDIDEWLAWAISNDIAPEVVAFIKARPTLLYQFHPTRPFPNPASWEYVSRLLKSGLKGDILYESVAGTVGEGTATEFIQYIKIYDRLPNIRDILDGKIEFVPTELDLTYAVCAGMAHIVKDQNDFDRAMAYSKLLPREFSIFLIKMLFTKDRVKTARTPSWHEIAQELVNEGVI